MAGIFVELTKTPICFSARGNKYGTFSIAKPGQISSFKLVHVSGAVGAYPNAAGKWGTAGHRFDTIITDNSNTVISPPFSMLDKTYYKYSLPNANSKYDPVLFLPAIEPPFNVIGAQAMRVWFSEDLKNYAESDNYGTSCAHVYAKYKNFY